MKYSTDAATIYHSFKQFPGSDYIASEFAIGELIKWVRKLKPRRVLEVGAGIGTLTFTLASLKQELDFEFITTEWNESCRTSLLEILSEQKGDFRLISSMDDLDSDTDTFELTVIDGGIQDERYFSRISPRGVIFIEGFMEKKQFLIHDIYRGKRTYVFSNFRSPTRQKGIWIFRFEPNIYEKVRFFWENLENRAYSAAKRRELFGLGK